MIRFGILGHFAEGLDYNDGQTVKTREMYDELAADKRFKLSKADTYYMKRSVSCFLKAIIQLISNNEKIIICLSWPGYQKVLPILVLLAKIFNCQLYDVVIAGNRQDHLVHSKFYRYLCSTLSGIYVELFKMVKEYNTINLKNVKYMPNFKNIKKETIVLGFKSLLELPICTFSRVCQEKGVEDAIAAVKKVNGLYGHNRYVLTIYGPIESDYVPRFNKLRQGFPDYIRYGGIIKYKESSEAIKESFILLFPTLYKNEGFPGTIIDAFAAGVPIISTDVSSISEIIQSGVTGFIYPIHDVDALAKKLIYCAEHIDEMENMRRKCSKKFDAFLPCNAMKVLKEDLLDGN